MSSANYVDYGQSFFAFVFNFKGKVRELCNETLPYKNGQKTKKIMHYYIKKRRM